MFRFETLDIWKLAIEYGIKCYDVADKFPKIEQFALADQLRRAAISVSNNIAEGSTGSDRTFNNYLEHSIGSTLETVNILIFASKKAYIGDEAKISMYQNAETLIKKLRSFKKTLAL